MISMNINIPEGTKDSAGRTVQVGDVLHVHGRFDKDGKFHVNNAQSIRTLTAKIDLGESQ